jgi:hypothetical protein
MFHKLVRPAFNTVVISFIDFDSSTVSTNISLPTQSNHNTIWESATTKQHMRPVLRFK